ncbi:DUF2628 domain-containing protein [Niabella ginsengisoli]|uniref:DUF2628 domain-containing protein n=1 Tax=Niabella ginsengisoli TaxID=522298 RepID=A0ABS9SR89_9BACT|nr:DUF2628 domain-containing protein [Niabella ginsengisoli]MCH5600741.1 DUF2628 domain-containing protein [Niabella ginsengisoli]
MQQDIELYETYFQNNKSYYIDKWAKFHAGQKISFNFFAFLLGLFWFMYRKMYIETAVLIIAIIIESGLETIILPNDIEEGSASLINLVATIAIATAVGFLGNLLYIRKADKIVQEAKTKFSDSEQQKNI